MGRNAKQTDPLHPRASRVEKARRVRTRLPSWYYRVLSLRWDREPFKKEDPHDFDEDLSELEEQSEQGEDAESLQGRADGAEECECASEDSEYEESEKSYDGSDADCYYDWKEQREERKREKLEERKAEEKLLELEKSKEEEVRAAYKSLRKAEKKNNTTPVRLSLSDEAFNLFCTDHVEYYKSVSFGRRDYSDVESDESDVTKLKSGNEIDLYGIVYFGRAVFTFGPFRPPTHASCKPVKVKSSDGTHELSFQFIGNGYLKLRISRDMVLLGLDTPSEGPPTTAPASFDFFGIWRDIDKEIAERERILKEARARRPPSPRETWFEMNHPMGAWNSGW
ncbi:hypothetical protein KVR01_007527 [Diaporthe batatas]|uniref:uncharacterized protein n=1 Tax=Diaporthe batatas TaxID=748121 RepID=UPI001D03A45B|nr:uncharacterized protein KVR01_007527 [Diaporthe batatas]KAG8163049.1 hypothetical protein KVR01_007527 [Diaporthe batatas]